MRGLWQECGSVEGARGSQCASSSSLSMWACWTSFSSQVRAWCASAGAAAPQTVCAQLLGDLQPPQYQCARAQRLSVRVLQRQCVSAAIPRRTASHAMHAGCLRAAWHGPWDRSGQRVPLGPHHSASAAADWCPEAEAEPFLSASAEARVWSLITCLRSDQKQTKIQRSDPINACKRPGFRRGVDLSPKVSSSQPLASYPPVCSTPVGPNQSTQINAYWCLLRIAHACLLWAASHAVSRHCGRQLAWCTAHIIVLNQLIVFVLALSGHHGAHLGSGTQPTCRHPSGQAEQTAGGRAAAPKAQLPA